MDTALRIANAVLPLLYLLTAVAYGMFFFSGHRTAERVAAPLLRGTLVVHLGYLVLLAVRWHQFPAATVSQSLSALAFAIAVIYAFVEWHGRSLATGFWPFSLALVFEFFSSVLRSTAPPNLEIFHSPLFAVHASLGLLGYAGFGVGACYAFLFLRMYIELKRGQFSLFFGKLPPLEVLEQMMRDAMLTGFVGLTGTVVSGAVWADRLFDGPWLADPKIIITMLTWLFYGAVLLLARLRRWRGRRLAWASLLGFAAIVLSLFTNFYFSDLHAFV